MSKPNRVSPKTVYGLLVMLTQRLPRCLSKPGNAQSHRLLHGLQDVSWCKSSLFAFFMNISKTTRLSAAIILVDEASSMLQARIGMRNHAAAVPSDTFSPLRFSCLMPSMETDRKMQRQPLHLDAFQAFLSKIFGAFLHFANNNATETRKVSQVSKPRLSDHIL